MKESAETSEPDKLQSSVTQGASVATSFSTRNENECLVPEQQSQPESDERLPKAAQSVKNQIAELVVADCNKQPERSSSFSTANEATKSGEGLNLISSLMDVELSEPLVNQKQKEDALASRVQKNSKRKGSASSTSALSDIIQDIRISPRDAKIAAESMPTKGTVCPVLQSNLL